jgi:hypothetical protein
MSLRRKKQAEKLIVSPREGGISLFVPVEGATSLKYFLEREGFWAHRDDDTFPQQSLLEVRVEEGDVRRAEAVNKVARGWQVWWERLDDRAAYDLRRLWAVLSWMADRQLSEDEFETLMGEPPFESLLERPRLMDWLDEWDIDDEADYPFGETFTKKKGKTKNSQHGRQMGEKELEEWYKRIKDWKDEIDKLKRGQEKGRAKQIKDLKGKITDGYETIKFEGEQHSQRDKGYRIPGFHELEEGDE